jgi:hypothetical protein
VPPYRVTLHVPLPLVLFCRGFWRITVARSIRNALLRSLRYQGERGFTLMPQRWSAIQHVSVSPTTIGDIIKSVLVLTQFEHKMIS